MIKRILKLSFSLAAIFFHQDVLGKEKFFIPTNAKVSFDLGKLLYYGLLINQYNKAVSYSYKSSGNMLKNFCPTFEGNYYEMNGALSFGKVILDVDFGYANPTWKVIKFAKHPYTKENIMNSQTGSKGFFLKYGLCYNFLIETGENNAAFVGVKHAIAIFDSHIEDWITHEYSAPYVDSERRYISEATHITDKKTCLIVKQNQKNLFAHWFEVLAGVKLRVFDYVYIGSTVRYKFFLNVHRDKLFKPFDIPGWGRTDDCASPSCLGFSFYISINIPLQNSPKYNRMDYKTSEDKISFIKL